MSRDEPNTGFVELPADDLWRMPEGAIDLVIGGSSWHSTAGSPTPIVSPLIGAIDDRFWRGPVDFAGP